MVLYLGSYGDDQNPTGSTEPLAPLNHNIGLCFREVEYTVETLYHNGSLQDKHNEQEQPAAANPPVLLVPHPSTQVRTDKDDFHPSWYAALLYGHLYGLHGPHSLVFTEHSEIF